MPAETDYDITDSELLKRYYSEQDNKWLGILLPRYTVMLLGVCMKYLKNEEDAKDCVQQVFLKVISELPKYEVEYFKSWIYMVAKNHCLMKLRGDKNYQVEITENLLQTEADAEEKKKHLEKEELLTSLEDALKELNEEQRKCVHLFYLQKKTYAEVAEITGYSMLQVKSHLQNGKRKLKIAMGVHV